MIEQPRHHRRDRVPAADPVSLDQLQHFSGLVPAAGEYERVADRHATKERLHAADMKERAGDGD